MSSVAPKDYAMVGNGFEQGPGSKDQERGGGGSFSLRAVLFRLRDKGGGRGGSYITAGAERTRRRGPDGKKEARMITGCQVGRAARAGRFKYIESARNRMLKG